MLRRAAATQELNICAVIRAPDRDKGYMELADVAGNGLCEAL